MDRTGAVERGNVKTISIDTWERVQLALIVSGGRGTFGQVELGLKALKVLRLTDGEKASIGYVELGSERLAWADEQEYELEFDDDVWQLVQALTSNYQTWPIDERVGPLRDRVVE